MNETLEKARAALQEKLAGSDFEHSVTFVVEGEGNLRAENGEVTESDGESEITMTAAADVFQDILNGDLDGTAAFMSGKLKIDGDMAAAMQLGSILS